VIVARELAAGIGTRTQILRANPPLIYALESIKNALGGWAALSRVGVTTSYVNYVKTRANIGTTDERHAPSDPAAVSSLSAPERRECMKRVRTVIERYASSL
jgi:hypothetical protein